MTELILHQYPQSPVAEKVRAAIGIKGLAWRAVEIPRLPPKPKLTALTGGYRRTPVLQIGADIYCDSLCILREIDRRFPEPPFCPEPFGAVMWGITQWTGGSFFTNAVTVALAHAPEELDGDFAKDRGRLYFGPDCDFTEIARTIPHAAAQLAVAFGWMEESLAAGKPYLGGERPALPDALIYALVWLVRGRWPGGPEVLGRFPNVVAWEDRMRAIGHGAPTPMDADEALAVARDSEPAEPEPPAEADPQGLQLGQPVTVTPAGDSGDPSVAGVIYAFDHDRVSLLRQDTVDLGRVVVHFPRMGYRVEPV